MEVETEAEPDAETPKSSEGVDEIEIARNAAWLLLFLVRTFSRYSFVFDPPRIDLRAQHRSTSYVCSCKPPR